MNRAEAEPTAPASTDSPRSVFSSWYSRSVDEMAMAAAATARKLNEMVMNESSRASDPPIRLTMSRILPVLPIAPPMSSTTLPMSRA